MVIEAMQGHAGDQEQAHMHMPSTPPRTVIAFAGRCGAGKDASADALARRLGFVNVKFAQPLKDAAALLFGLPAECFSDRALKDAPHAALRGSSPRQVLQWLGTDVMQHGLQSAGLLPGIGRRFWAVRLADAIDALPAECGRVVVSDMRFPHELELLRERFGGTHPAHRLVAVRLERPAGAGSSAAADHESESAVDGMDVDAVLRNDGTLEQLEASVLRLALERTNVRTHQQEQP